MWLFFHDTLEFQEEKKKKKICRVTLTSPSTAGLSQGLMDCALWCITASSDAKATPMIRRGKISFINSVFSFQLVPNYSAIGTSSTFLLASPPSLSKQKEQDPEHFFVVLWVALVGQRSSCSDLVFSNKCALCRSTLLRDNTARRESSAWPLIKHKCGFVRPRVITWTSANQETKHSSSALQTPKTKGQLTFLISFCAKHVNTVSSLSLMLKTCQLVNILGGTVVYGATKTVMLSSVFFSPPIGKDWLILVNFF